MESRGLRRRDVDPVRLSRSIADAVSHFEAREPERVEALWQSIQAYRSLLAQYHQRDEAVRRRRERLPARAKLVYSWDAIAGFPLFGYGAARQRRCRTTCRAGSPTGWRARRPTTPRSACWPAWWHFRSSGGWRPGWCSALAGVVVGAGLCALAADLGRDRVSLSDRGRLAPRPAPVCGPRCHPEPARARRLVAEREAIVAELERARQDYLAATKGSSF